MNTGLRAVVVAAMVIAAVAVSVPVGILVDQRLSRDGEAAFGPVFGEGIGGAGDDLHPVSREDVATTFQQLNDWWSEVDAELGFVFVPLQGDDLADGTSGATCDGVPVSEDPDVVDNAYAAVCDEGPIIAYDPAYVRSAPEVMKVTLAHEFAHHIQFQEGRLDPGRKGDAISSELQADCWAGAWAAVHLPRDEFPGAERDVLASGDGIGGRNSDEDAHGSPSRRLAAWRHGVAGGVTACAGDAFTPLLP